MQLVLFIKEHRLRDLVQLPYHGVRCLLASSDVLWLSGYFSQSEGVHSEVLSVFEKLRKTER